MPQYLEKRRRRWYAVMDVPKDVQHVLNKRRFVQSLGTESLSVAERTRWPLIAKWQDLIQDARTSAQDVQATLRTLRNEQEEYTAIVPQMKDGKVQMVPLWEANLLALDQASGSLSETENPELDAMLSAKDVLLGKRFMLSEYVDTYVQSSKVNEKTKRTKTRQLKRLTEKFPYADECTYEALIDWVTDDLLSDGMARNTLRNHLSQWDAFWRWCRRKGLKDQSPFDGDLRADVLREARSPAPRTFWTTGEYHHLLDNVRPDDINLKALIQIAAHTGARREAICNLQKSDIDLQNQTMTLHARKYEHEDRTIPIHPALSQLLESLVADSEGGYLFKGLSIDKDGNRGNTLGQRFSLFKTKLGYDERHTLHSFRHTVNSMLTNAGVEESVRAAICGWTVKAGTTGTKVYTHLWQDTLRHAMTHINYNKD